MIEANAGRGPEAGRTRGWRGQRGGRHGAAINTGHALVSSQVLAETGEQITAPLQYSHPRADAHEGWRHPASTHHPAGGKVMTRPLLTAAFTCERVLHEVDGVLTAVRIVDSYTITGTPAAARTLVRPWMVIIFKSGDARGTYAVSFAVRRASGQVSALGTPIPIELKGGAHGATLSIELVIEVEEDGVYWVDVLLDGERVTSMPLTLRRIVDAAEGQGPPPPSRP